MTNIRIYADKTELTRAAADYVLECYRNAVTEHGDFALALSGGSTPRGLFQLLTTPAYSGQIDWQKVEVFWGDERTVPPDHADSNYRMAKETLLDHVPLPADNIHRVLAELPPVQAAQAYEDTLRQFFESHSGQPRFDLVLLGMGDDGHTASLFPHTAALDETEPWVVANHVPQLDTWRITLTYPVINHAAHIVFLVSGTGKAAPLKAVLEGPRQPHDLPSQGIQPTEGELVWLVDQDAAAQLTETT